SSETSVPGVSTSGEEEWPEPTLRTGRGPARTASTTAASFVARTYRSGSNSSPPDQLRHRSAIGLPRSRIPTAAAHGGALAELQRLCKPLVSGHGAGQAGSPALVERVNWQPYHGSATTAGSRTLSPAGFTPSSTHWTR